MIIYGKNMVLEALRNKDKIKKVYLTKNNLDLVEKYKQKISKIQISSIKELDMLASGNHQGIIAEVEEYSYISLEEVIKKHKDDKNVSFAILDGLEDPHNLGAILRSADASGIDGIIIPKNRSVQLSSTVAKVSTGAIEYVDVIQVVNLVNTIKTLKENGYWIIGLELDGSVDYRKQDYTGKIAVIIGSEGRGISKLVKENCDYLVNIPMVGHVNSLNASVSASILFYEILRNRE